MRLGRARTTGVASLAVVALSVAGCGGGDDASDRSVSASSTATTAPAPSVTTGTAPPAGVQATTPATPSTPGSPALPAQIPRFALAPVPIGSARESLVFRTRNAILNGLSGQASGYALEIAEAAGGGETGLLIGVVARPGASPPNIPNDVSRLIEVEPEATFRVHGHEVALHQAPGYHLAVVDGGPRQAVVAIGVSRPLARDIATAVAEALPAS